MLPTKPRDDEPPADYENLRRHLGRPPLEHPVARQVPAAPTAPAAARSPRLSMMDWLLAIGHAAFRRLRRVPCSPMAKLHPRK
ncbi:MAG TPA: hypothetical protein VF469_31770 [Kofleriaceae bacterium]